MMAVKAGFSNVFACDESHVMYSIALKALPSNHVDDKVTLFHRHSTDLSEADLLISAGKGDGEKTVDVVVTETVDCGT